jgi:hypothetical protein
MRFSGELELHDRSARAHSQANCLHCDQLVRLTVSADQASPRIGDDVADVLGLDTDGDRKRIRRMIEAWLRSGALMKANVMDGGRKFRPCVQVGEWASG